MLFQSFLEQLPAFSFREHRSNKKMSGSSIAARSISHGRVHHQYFVYLSSVVLRTICTIVWRVVCQGFLSNACVFMTCYYTGGRLKCGSKITAISRDVSFDLMRDITLLLWDYIVSELEFMISDAIKTAQNLIKATLFTHTRH